MQWAIPKRCEALSNEVVQRSMLANLGRRADVFEAARENPMSWMHAIVRNRAIDKIRRKTST